MNEDNYTPPQRPQINANPDGSFMDEDQIVEDLKTRVAPETRRAMAAADSLHGLDFLGFGRWIRNSYGLWFEDNPHTTLKWVTERELPENTQHGCDASPSHPDNFSGRVMDKFHAWLRENPQ